MAIQTRTSRTMSDEHKDSLVIGREQTKIVRQYLTALEEYKPRRGRPVTPETVEKRLLDVSHQLEIEQNVVRRLQLVMEREALEERKKHLVVHQNVIPELERQFVSVAKDYSARKRVSVKAWRTMGVPARVLREAGITRA